MRKHLGEMMVDHQMCMLMCIVSEVSNVHAHESKQQSHC